MMETADFASQAIEELGQAVVDSFGVAGLAIGVVRGEQVYGRGFGVKSIATGEPVTENDLFHLASVSKTFVSAAILQLVESGRIDLDAPVAGYLPVFHLDDQRYHAITVRQMLNHTSGMPDTDDYGWDRPEYDDQALERYVRGLAGERLIAAPGERFEYSNIAYEVLGLLVAHVSGETFEGYVKAHLLDPLEMAASTFLKTEVPPERATTPHVLLPPLALSPDYPYNRAHAPSSTLHSSALEMCNWARLHLKRGSFHGRRLLQPGSYAQLWYPYAPSSKSRPDESYGLGWFLDRYRGRHLVRHDGEDLGYTTDLVLLPEESLAVIVLANTFPAPVYRITNTILDLLLGYAPEPFKPPPVVQLGEVLAGQGVAAAAAGYRRLQAAQPDRYDFSAGSFAGLGSALIETQRWAEAEALLGMGAELHPGDEELAGLIGQLPGEQGA